MTRGATCVSTGAMVLAITALAVLMLSAAPADAQVYRPHPERDGWGSHGYPARYGPGFEFGFEDGYRDGYDAARRGRHYDPYRERRYREGDSGYRRRFGPRDLYRRDYRQGFLTGYDRGYRDAMRSRRHWDRRWDGPWRW